MQEAIDLFGNHRILTQFKENGKAKTSERGELIGYFHKRAMNKTGEQYPVSFIAMKLSHLKETDLYYMKSVLEDAVRRGGNWNKTFFGMLKV